VGLLGHREKLIQNVIFILKFYPNMYFLSNNNVLIGRKIYEDLVVRTRFMAKLRCLQFFKTNPFLFSFNYTGFLRECPSGIFG
jgi:hypothetical protein